MQRQTVRACAHVFFAGLCWSAISPARADEADTTDSFPSRRMAYVRADLGYAWHDSGAFSQAGVTANGGTFVSSSIGEGFTGGAGIGWQVSERFRFDLTGEYRSSAGIDAKDSVIAALQSPAGTLDSSTTYRGELESLAFLVNGYWDIGRWHGFTPYIGAGIGFARNSIEDFVTHTNSIFTDSGTKVPVLHTSEGYALDNSQFNFAWALMAGASYDLNERTKLDFGYRYINLGSVDLKSGLIQCLCGTVGDPLKIADVDAHEFRIGLRISLTPEAPYSEHAP